MDRCGGFLAGLALVSLAAPAVAQAPVRSDERAASKAERIVTVQDAIAALERGSPPAKAAGLRGDPGRFFGPDDYPVDALRAGEQGRVVASLWIDTAGKVASCTVTGSSGSASLDQATCRIALDKVTFTPATDRKGHALASRYTLPVRWILPSGGDPAPEAPTDAALDVTISVDAMGLVVACNSTATPPLPVQVQPCAEFPVGKPSRIRWSRDGKPVGGTVTRTIRQHVTLDP